MSERNSMGERLYVDSDGDKCDIHGMILYQRSWVASRFDAMMDQIESQDAKIAELRAAVDRLPKTKDGARVVPGRRVKRDDGQIGVILSWDRVGVEVEFVGKVPFYSLGELARRFTSEDAAPAAKKGGA